MKLSNMLAIAMVAIVGFGSLAYSPSAEANRYGCKYTLWDYKGKCSKKRSRIVERFINEYVNYKEDKDAEQAANAEALRLEKRKAVLLVTEAEGSLTKNEARELSKIDRKINSAYKKAANAKKKYIKHGLKLKELERDYEQEGGKAHKLRNIAEDTLDEVLDY